jgi:ribosomal-protein-alanine N-acetyltransferase
MVRLLAGEREVADTTLAIPHPYDDTMAEAWIGTHGPGWDQGAQLVYAITTKDDGLVGSVGLRIKHLYRRAELGYWIGVPYWNNGYATEAARAVLEFGFLSLGLNRILATHLTRNPASGRVMLKIGMQCEGILRQHVMKWGIPEDVATYAILRDEFARPD